MNIVPMSVELVDHMGSDLSVVNAARVSFDKESDWEDYYDNGKKSLSDRDAKLIRYLATNNHWTPFAHAFVSFRIKAPIFVARQLVKHQVGLAWNEVSRRYVDSEPEFWLPSEYRGRPVNTKQGSDGVLKDDWYTTEVTNNTVDSLLLYLDMVKDGVAPEQARMVLPLNTMTEWIWSGSLMAFCRVCKLRLDPHVQQETREVAEALRGLLGPLFPVSFNALLEGIPNV